MTFGVNLASDLQSIFEQGGTESDCADAWSNAISNYAAGIVPFSTSQALAKAALRSALTGFGAPGAGILALQTGLSAFCVALAAGMAPSFVGVAPPLPCPLESIALSYPPSNASAALIVTNIIDAWFRSGTSTPSGGGSPTPWI